MSWARIEASLTYTSHYWAELEHKPRQIQQCSRLFIYYTELKFLLVFGSFKLLSEPTRVFTKAILSWVKHQASEPVRNHRANGPSKLETVVCRIFFFFNIFELEMQELIGGTTIITKGFGWGQGVMWPPLIPPPFATAYNHYDNDINTSRNLWPC